VKLRRKVLALALAMSMMLAMPISGSADVGESSVQEAMNKEIQLEDGKVFYLKLSNPNMSKELVYEAIDDFTTWYGQYIQNGEISLLGWEDFYDSYKVEHEHTCSPMGPYQEYTGDWIIFTDPDTGEDWARVQYIFCRVSGCKFRAKGMDLL